MMMISKSLRWLVEQSRILDEMWERVEELYGALGAHTPLVVAETERHLALWLQRVHVELELRFSDGQYGYLRRIDDRREFGDAEHAQIGQAERTALELVQLKLALARLICQFLVILSPTKTKLTIGKMFFFDLIVFINKYIYLDVIRNGGDAESVGVLHYGRDEAIVGGNGDRYVDSG